MKVLQEPNLLRRPHGAFQLQTAMPVVMNDGREFVVPAGFITDFASSRVGHWNFLGDDAYLSYAAIVHDWLYKTGVVPKQQADRYFQEGLQSDPENVSWWDRWKGYWGVRVFGGRSWNHHRQTEKLQRTQEVVMDNPQRLPPEVHSV